MESGSLPGIPGRSHRKDTLIAADEQHPFQKPAALIVKEVFIPFVFSELGYDHDDAAIGMLFRKLEDELNDGNYDAAVGRRQETELWRLPARGAEGLLNVAFPVLAKQFGVLVGLDVQGDHFRRKPGGKFNSLAGDVAPAVDGNDGNGRLAETCSVDGNLASGENLQGVVVAADSGEKNNRQGNEEQRDPGAFNEFRNQHDDDGDAGDERADAIDERALPPMRTAIFPPVHDQSGLRKRGRGAWKEGSGSGAGPDRLQRCRKSSRDRKFPPAARPGEK